MIARPNRAPGVPVSDVLRLLPPYVAYGLLKRVVGLPRLARWAWRRPAGPAPARARRAVAAVTRISHRLSRDERDCLQRSLVLYRELSKAGAGPVMVLGFRREEGGLRGHAWVELPDAPGRSVMPEDVSGYDVAMSFRDEGRLARSDAPAVR